MIFFCLEINSSNQTPHIFLLHLNFKNLTVKIVYSYYIIHACEILKRSKINNYVINDMFKFQIFVVKNYTRVKNIKNM